MKDAMSMRAWISRTALWSNLMEQVPTSPRSEEIRDETDLRSGPPLHRVDRRGGAHAGLQRPAPAASTGSGVSRVSFGGTLALHSRARRAGHGHSRVRSPAA